MVRENVLSKGIYISSFIVNILLLVIFISCMDIKEIGNFFNSDSLYLPSLFKDLFNNHGSLSGWNVGTCTYFFPDFILYGLIEFCVHNFILSLFIYAGVQYFLLLFLLNKLFKTVFEHISFFSLSLINFLLSLFFLNGIVFHESVFITFYNMWPMHLGTFLNALLSIILSIQYLKTGEKRYFVWLFLINILSIISDNLYYLLYFIPVFLISFFIFKEYVRKRIILINAVNLLSIIFGILTTNILIRWLLNVSIGKAAFYSLGIWDSFKVFLKYTVCFLKAGNFHSLILYISILAFFLCIYSLFRKFNIIRWNTGNYNIEQKNYLFLLFIFLTSSMVLVAAPLLGIYGDVSAIRYNIYSYYLLLAVMVYLADYFFGLKHLIKYSAITFSLATLLFSGFKMFKSDFYIGLHNNANYYPSMVAQLDNIAAKDSLKVGVSGYWDANVISMFSKKGIKACCVYSDLCPYIWLNNENAFRDNRDGGKQKFNFILFPDLDSSYIQKIFATSYQKTHFCDRTLYKVTGFAYDSVYIGTLVKNKYKPLKTFFCNGEVLSPDSRFVTNHREITFPNNGIQYKGKAFSGKASIRLTKDNSCGLEYNEDTVALGTTYYVSVWKYPAQSKGQIYVSTKDQSLKMISKKIEKVSKNGWAKISIILNIKPGMENKGIKFNLGYFGNSYCLFDDYQICTYL